MSASSNRTSSRKGYNKRRRLFAAVLAVIIAAVLVIPLFGSIAARADETTGPFSLTVQAASSANDSFSQDLGTADFRIDLYKIASGTRDAGFDTWHWNLDAAYSSLSFNENTIDNAGYTALARQAANMELAADSSLTPTRSVTVGSGSAQVTFSGLEPGLYVIIPRDNGASDRSDIIVSGDDLMTLVNTSEWSYEFEPSITAVPSKAVQGGEPGVTAGQVGTGVEYGDWLSSVTVVLKASRQERSGSLEIVKTLRSFETKDPATFVFSIDAVKGTDEEGGAKKVYSDVVSITFDAAGEQSRVVSGIPVGATVTVQEVYSGASYQVSGADTQTAVVSAEEIKQVAFTNDYDDTYHGGGAVENEFAYAPADSASSSASPWEFTQITNGEVTKRIVNGEVVE